MLRMMRLQGVRVLYEWRCGLAAIPSWPKRVLDVSRSGREWKEKESLEIVTWCYHNTSDTGEERERVAKVCLRRDMVMGLQ